MKNRETGRKFSMTGAQKVRLKGSSGMRFQRKGWSNIQFGLGSLHQGWDFILKEKEKL